MSQRTIMSIARSRASLLPQRINTSSVRAFSQVRTAAAPARTALARSAPLIPAYQPAAIPAKRAFRTSATQWSTDSSWAQKGPVSYKELKPETEAPTGEITIIDVREPAEVASGMVPSAVNVPLSSFQSAFSGDGGDFKREYAFDRPSYGDKLVFYCRSGKRSAQALEFAQKQGWVNSRNYEGSWLDWVQQEEARSKSASPEQKAREDDD